MNRGIVGLSTLAAAAGDAVGSLLGVSIKAGRTKEEQSGSRQRRAKAARRNAEKQSRAANRRKR